ncbi:MAG TPA: VTT domain-containing protein [Candidatus Saccharibacteria bacterium]|nr:VTT domain-containing protein [Candidatus Saccharibacteria bacterium]
MIPGVDLVDFVTWASVWGVAAVIFAESGLLVGFFLPGDSILFTAGFLAHAGVLNFNIHLMVLIFFIAAVAGDSVGYTFGRRAGPRIFKRPNSLLFRKENVDAASEFYERHGGKAIILARFMPVIRTFAPIVAGVGKMNYRRFLTFNVIGALIWAVGVTYFGYYAGAWLDAMGIDIDHILLPIVAFIVITSVAPPLIHIFKDKKHRDAFWSALKMQRDKLLRRK